MYMEYQKYIGTKKIKEVVIGLKRCGIGFAVIQELGIER